MIHPTAVRGLYDLPSWC